MIGGAIVSRLRHQRRGLPRSVSLVIATLVLAAIVLDSLAHTPGSSRVGAK